MRLVRRITFAIWKRANATATIKSKELNAIHVWTIIGDSRLVSRATVTGSLTRVIRLLVSVLIVANIRSDTTVKSLSLFYLNV
jgi:hypothetical protein